jgi:hypothetical protein
MRFRCHFAFYSALKLKSENENRLSPTRKNFSSYQPDYQAAQSSLRP